MFAGHAAGSLFEVFLHAQRRVDAGVKPHQDGCDLLARRAALRCKEDLIADLGAVDDAERDGIGHRLTRPGGDLISVRERRELRCLADVVHVEDLGGKLHEHNCDLLARHGLFRLEGRG